MAKRNLEGSEFTCNVCQATATDLYRPSGWFEVAVYEPLAVGGDHIRREYHFCSDACYAAWKANGKEPRGDTLDSLCAEARDLGKRAADAHKALPTAKAYLRAADRVHGEKCRPITRKWLGAIRDYVDSLCKNRGLDPQPEPERKLTVAEAARALGRRAGKAGCLSTSTRHFLKGAQETYGQSYESALVGVIEANADRLRLGDWTTNG